MNAQVQKFVEAVKENARQSWTKPEDKEFIDSLLHVFTQDDGSVTISDNYERFFDIIYVVRVDGSWSYRKMWSESGELKSYSFEQAMSDASIMYTG